jgi:hypothetical protein
MTMAALTKLRNSLRSGDGTLQFAARTRSTFSVMRRFNAGTALTTRIPLRMAAS